MSHQRKRARRAAVQALYQWQLTQQNVREIEQQFIDEHGGTPTDMQFFHELLTGVTSQLDELDAAFEPFLDRKVDELDMVERAVLRLSTFELKSRLDIPFRVVINEGVDLAKTFGADQSYKYINGVLDKVAKQLRTLEQPNNSRK
ncbi:MAG: transcription antitermination factor NusB [Pseudomonadota bacterium]